MKYIYLENENILFRYAYLALKDHFKSEDDFKEWFENLGSDKKRDTLLKIAPYHLALVKNGDWKIQIPDSNEVIDYFTNTYKFIAIFSFIESLSEENHIDFYQYLIRKKTKTKFPISKNEFDTHYKEYKAEFGAIKRCISFFENLSKERQRDLVSKLKVDSKNIASIENFAKHLYGLRSKFVHEAKLIHHLSDSTFLSVERNKSIRCSLTMDDTIQFFEEGLLAWCDE